ncbi:MAG: NUDIX hydrolase [Candidatus Heimdallarchaeota archaeon]
MFEEFLGSLLSDYRPEVPPATGLQRAAVLVPICELYTNSSPRVIFTKRSATVRHHKGEISFPGGVQEDGEALEGTALRETQEELGTALFRVLGRLDDFITITDYVVTPFVGYLRECPSWVPNKEVDRIIQVPLVDLLKKKHWETQTFYRGQHEIPVHFFQWHDAPASNSLEGDKIWGATAQILLNFLTIVRDSPDMVAYLHSF